MGPPGHPHLRSEQGGCKPAIAADGRAQTSPLAVIEAAAELPELGEAGVTAFSMRRGSNCATCRPAIV